MTEHDAAPAPDRSSGRVRAATSDDVGEIYAMVRELADYERSLHEVESSEDDFRAALCAPQPAVYAHVVEHDPGDDGPLALAGFAIWFVNFSTWTGRHGIWLEDLFVRPHLRGHGYGRALLRALAAVCTERGYPRLDWWVLDWNEPALGFYRSLGAVGMDDWTVHRLTGPALEGLSR